MKDNSKNGGMPLIRLVQNVFKAQNFRLRIQGVAFKNRLNLVMDIFQGDFKQRGIKIVFALEI